MRLMESVIETQCMIPKRNKRHAQQAINYSRTLGIYKNVSRLNNCQKNLVNTSSNLVQPGPNFEIFILD